MENPPGTERKGSLSEQQHMTGILGTSRLTRPAGPAGTGPLPAVPMLRSCELQPPAKPAQLISKGTRHQPFRKVAVFMVKIHIYIKKKRRKMQPPQAVLGQAVLRTRPFLDYSRYLCQSSRPLNGSMFCGILCVCVFPQTFQWES